MTSGIHHVTLIAADVQANVDFYVGFLGLRLVKQTGGYEDARQLHLFYGDHAATPGSLITFLIWQGGSAGQAGAGQVSELALAIAPGSIGFWLERALRHQVKVEGTATEFGEPVLRLRDPDGVVVKLVGADMPVLTMLPNDIPIAHAIRRIRGVTMLSEVPEETVAFLTRYFGFRTGPQEGTTQRLVSEIGDSLDIQAPAPPTMSPCAPWMRRRWRPLKPSYASAIRASRTCMTGTISPRFMCASRAAP
jgi:phospholipase/carboxylesterase